MRIPSTIALLLTVFVAVASAADDDEVVVGPIVANNDAQQMQMQRMVEANFDQWMWQNTGDARQGEQRIRTQSRLQMSELQRVCELTPQQQQKLELAARGDIERFLEEVETLRRKFNALKGDQNAVNQMWQEIQPLQQKQSRGLTGPGSLFTKTVPKTLTAEQAARYEVITEERRRFRYKASVAVALHTIEAGVGLKAEQREKLQQVLDELPPPRAFGQYDHYLIMYRLAGLPPEKIQPHLDARQWTALKQQFNQYRDMKPFLIEQGLLDREELGQEPPAEAKP